MEKNYDKDELQQYQDSEGNNLLPDFQKTLEKEIYVSYDTKTKIVGSYDATTLKLFGALSNAYNYFQVHLFDDMLSHVVLTLNRNTRSGGYYMESGWVDDGEIKPEININPKMLHYDAIFVMSILVHELCHHMQSLYGKPGRGRYHNKQYAKIMEAIGLMCSHNGKPGGNKTGDSMSHYIIEGGRFKQVFDAMPKKYLLPFTSAIPPKTEKEIATAQKKIKTKYKCATCAMTVWGAPHQYVLCGNCKSALIERT